MQMVKSFLRGIVLWLCRALPEATNKQVVSYCRDQHKGIELLSCFPVRDLPAATMLRE